MEYRSVPNTLSSTGGRFRIFRIRTRRFRFPHIVRPISFEASFIPALTRAAFPQPVRVDTLISARRIQRFTPGRSDVQPDGHDDDVGALPNQPSLDSESRFVVQEAVVGLLQPERELAGENGAPREFF